MIKLVVALLSAILAVLSSIPFFDMPYYWVILIFLGFTLVYILFFIFLFFFVVMILVIPVNTKKPAPQYNSFYRGVLRIYTKMALSLFNIKVKVEGFEKLPKDSNFIIVGNHRSNVDSMIIDVYLKNYPLVYVTKKSLFKIPFFGKVIYKVGYLKLNRDNLRSELMTINRGVEALNTGKISVGVFPEGTRNHEYDLLPFKSGCYHLATKSHKPIVVCCLTGTEFVKHNPLFKKHPVTLRIIDVIEYDDYKDLRTIQIAEMTKKIISDNLMEIEGKK